jgi:hypothetical protein
MLTSRGTLLLLVVPYGVPGRHASLCLRVARVVVVSSLTQLPA